LEQAEQVEQMLLMQLPKAAMAVIQYSQQLLQQAAVVVVVRLLE
jgi:hypothetical protein